MIRKRGIWNWRENIEAKSLPGQVYKDRHFFYLPNATGIDSLLTQEHNLQKTCTMDYFHWETLKRFTTRTSLKTSSNNCTIINKVQQFDLSMPIKFHTNVPNPELLFQNLNHVITFLEFLNKPAGFSHMVWVKLNYMNVALLTSILWTERHWNVLLCSPFLNGEQSNLI